MLERFEARFGRVSRNVVVALSPLLKPAAD
jgi:hypothetical protein